MSFPLDIIPMMDRVTVLRIAAVTAEKCEPQILPTPKDMRILQWQTGLQQDTLAEKPLPNNKPLPATPARLTKGKKAWRSTIETLRPGEKKKRRAREFDIVMRREMENPVGLTRDVSWATMLGGTQGMNCVTVTDFISEAGWSESEDEGNLVVGLGNIKEEEEDKVKAGDKITALPPMPAHLLGRTPTRKEKKLVKKAKNTLL